VLEYMRAMEWHLQYGVSHPEPMLFHFKTIKQRDQITPYSVCNARCLANPNVVDKNNFLTCRFATLAGDFTVWYWVLLGIGSCRVQNPY